MYSKGEYPCAIRDKNSRIVVEAAEIDDNYAVLLDRFEYDDDYIDEFVVLDGVRYKMYIHTDSQVCLSTCRMI